MGKALYSVKWYRGQHEFFRYIPQHKPSMTAFPIPGIEVDIMGSGAHQVTLINVPTNISGLIKCEVSAEGTFSTGCDSANLKVIEMGIRDPIITSNKNNDMTLRLPVNCSAQVTNPPPKISFYIENEKVSPEMVVNLAPGLASLSPFAINNKFRLHSKYNTPIWIRCEAAVRGIYHLSSSSVPIIPDDVSKSSFSTHQVSLLVIFLCCFVSFIDQYYFVNARHY
ncbi:uncharacterized protein isoform X2 [Rhodnius prolixus]